MVDKKVADWVDKCVDIEYKRNRKRYDLSVGVGNARIAATLKVGRNLENYVLKTDPNKVNAKKYGFMVLASDYANRIQRWYDLDKIQRYGKNYYKDGVWRNK